MENRCVVDRGRRGKVPCHNNSKKQINSSNPYTSNNICNMRILLKDLVSEVWRPQEFHFFFLSSKFLLHFLSSPFSHTLSFFAFTQGKSYIKVVVKSLLLKICSQHSKYWKSAPHPHSKYLFPLSSLQSSFAKQYVKILFSPTQLVWFLFWHSQRLFMRISWQFVVYPGIYSEKYFYPGKYFISKIPCSRHIEVRV